MMLPLWYVCDGIAEEYSGQTANWNNSLLVHADSVEEALMKVMRYHLKIIEPRHITYGNETIKVIP